MDFLNDLLLKTFLPFEWKAIAVFVIASAWYFIAEYKAKRNLTDFDWKYWKKDNILNLIVTIGAFVLYNITSEIILGSIILLIALGVNQILAWIMGWKDKIEMINAHKNANIPTE